MRTTRILIVEDESVIAKDLGRTLEKLGYAVTATVSLGKQAIEEAAASQPDLVLMDIKLKGEVDGIEAAQQVHARFNVPVVYLTAYADEKTLQRAKITEPFGYVLKPFTERELHSAIEIALYRHQMERRLRQSERRFRSLIENASDVITLLDGDHTIRYVSPSVERILGHKPESLMGKSVSDFLHPDDVARIRHILTDTLPEAGSFRLGEARFRHRDGSWQWLESVGNNRLEDPVVKSIVVDSRDVTERKVAREALRDREERFRDLVEHSFDLICTHDLQGRLLSVNPAAERISGYTAEQLVGTNLRDFLAPQVRDQFGDYLAEIEGKGESSGLMRVVTSSGEQRIWEYHNSLRAEGVPAPIVRGMARDITERKRAEEALLDHEKRLVKAQQVAHMGFLDWNLKTNELLCSDEVYEMYGVSREEVPTTPEFVATVVHPDDLEYVQGNLDLAIRGEKEYDIDHRIVRPDGKVLWVHAQAELARDADGNPETLLGTIVDITERKRAEQALRESEERLKEAQAMGRLGNWEFDIDSQTMDWSDQVFELYERDPAHGPPTPEEATHYAPEQAKILRDCAQRAIETGEELECDLEAKLPSGRTAHFSASMRPVKDERGRVVKLFGTVQDITRRKQAEQLLQALNRAALAMERAFTPEQVFAAVAEEFKELGFSCALFLTDEGQTRLYPKYLTQETTAIKAAERLVGLKLEGFSIPVDGVDAYRKVVREKKTVFVESGEHLVRQILPQPVRGFARQIVKVLKVAKAIDAPLVVEDEVIGILAVQSDELTEADMPAVAAFAHQVAAAWSKAQLFQETRRLKQFNEDIVQSMAEGIVVEDPEGQITFVNPMAADLLGYSPEEIVGRHWRSVVPAECLQQVIQETAKRPQGIAGRYETALLRSDGREIPAIVSARPLFDGDEFSGVLSVFTDITERKQAEDALVESEFRLRQMADNVGDVFWITEWDTKRTVYASKAYEKTWGRTLQSLYEDREGWADAIHPEDRDRAWENFVRLGKGETYDEEYRIITPEGEVRWIRDRGYPIRGKQEGVTRVVGVARDITERKQAQEALARRHRELTSLYQAVTAISSDLSLEAVLQAIAEEMARALKTGGCALSLWNRDENQVETLIDYSLRRPTETEPAGTIYDVNDYPATLKVL
ncbi:MAG: PAS domain S-box protein, partial [Anaerolineae bacterium]